MEGDMRRAALAATLALACAGPAFAQGFKLESPEIKPNGSIAEEQVFTPIRNSRRLGDERGPRWPR
jgi:hypothetical protein